VSAVYPAFLRRVLFPALDVLNGTRIAELVGSLESSQWLPADKLRALQERKLRATLSWTREHVPFYRELWDKAPDACRARSAHPELDGLPVVTKEDLRSRLADFPVPAFRGRALTIKTSGSTGEPMTYYRSTEQDSWFWALRFRMWGWGGYVIGEPYLTLNLNPRTALRKRIQDVLFRCSYHGFNAHRHDVDAALRDLRTRRVKHLVGYASSLYLLSRAMLDRGIENPGVTSVLSTGDTLLPHYRRTVEQVFGVRVVDYYGAGGEGFHLASQCEQRGEYHLHPENAVIEVLRGRVPARPGEMGEIVVTQLDNQAMPLVRYATRDVATVSAATGCPCGRSFPLWTSVEGRLPDIVWAPDGSALVVHFFTILFEHLKGIRQFQIVQRERSTIEARIVVGDGYDRQETEAAIRRAVAGATHGSLGVGFDYVDDIGVSGSGKRRFVVSEMAPEGLGATPAAPDGRGAGSVG